MKSTIHALFVSTFLALTLSGSSAEDQWVQSDKSGDIAYFLCTTPPRIERIALTNTQWLAPIDLPNLYGPPSVFHVDTDGIYVGYNKSLQRYDLDGGNGEHLLNLADPIQDILTDGDLILINHSSYLYARLTSVSKSFSTVISSFENYVDSVYGASIAPGINKIFGRSEGVSPSDITYVSYSDTGTFIEGGDSPHHGDYPGATRTWVFPGESQVVDSAGIVYQAGSLTYLASLGGKIDDIDFHGPDIPVVLRGKEIVVYSNALLPVGSRSLEVAPKKIYVVGTNVLSFTPDLYQPNGIRTDIIPLSTLNAPIPGQPVDPVGLAYTPDDVFIDTNGVLLLFSKPHQSLFRWDTQTQKYLSTIPLLDNPRFAAYSAANHKVYVAYSSGLIRQIDLSSTNFLETPFAALAKEPWGLATADTFVFAMDGSGAWGTHYLFNAAGYKTASKDWNHYSSEYVWSQPNQKMYFFRDDTSPNDLLWEPINSDGTFGGYQDSPLHESTGFVHPIRVSPDGGVVLLGSGVLHDAKTLERLLPALANSILDAAWLTNGLHTVRNTAGVQQFQEWSSASYGLSKIRQLPGQAYRLLALASGQLLGVSIQEGIPLFYVMDSDFNVVPPAILEPPTGVLAEVLSTNQVRITWNDISGDEGYSIERRIGGAGPWTQLETVEAGITSFVDNSVVMGTIYSYRVTSRNGTQSSSASAEVTAALVIPATPSDFAVTSVSSNQISLAWKDVDYESGYILERRVGEASSWLSVATLKAGTTNYVDTGLVPATSYQYQLRANNGVGASAYSAEIAAATDLVPPTVPALATAYATGPFLVVLSWSHSSYEDAYGVERRDSPNMQWVPIATLGRDETGYVDTSVQPLATYEYRIYATNALGRSDYSAVRTVATPQIPAPLAPAAMAAKPLSSSSLLVSWGDVAYEAGYRLERRTDGLDSWALVALLPADTVRFADTNLIEKTEYFYRVQAFNDYGKSPYSAIASAKPLNLINLAEDDFDPDLNSNVWANVTGGFATNGGIGFLGSKALWFNGAGQRSATLFPANVSEGGRLEFLIRAGSAWIDEGICWDTSEWNEYIVLEYTKDNGASWTEMEFLDTSDPLLSEWTAYSITLPQAAWGSHTQLRWRQCDNSGAGFDQWALEDMCLEGVVPNPPSPPPFIISSANSATAVAIFWAGADGATSYEIERRQGAQNWMPLASISASTTYYTDTSALPSSAYSYRVRSVNAGGTSAFSTVTTSLTWSQQEEWFSQNYGSPDAGDPEQLKNPGPDGKVPLLRFAFNLSANEPWYDYQPGKRGGGPGVWLDASNGQIHTRFIRRKASTNPGITYVVQFGDAPGHWTHSGSLVTISTIDSIWEEVEYKDDISSNDKGTRFCRVGVQLE